MTIPTEPHYTCLNCAQRAKHLHRDPVFGNFALCDGCDSRFTPTSQELLIDPDCRDGKCGSCIGDPCQHHCHPIIEGVGI